MSTAPAWHELVTIEPDDFARTLPATKLTEDLHRADRAGPHDGRPRTGPMAAFRTARRAFIAGERLDMGALADELEVDRATLFRWVGNRDQLLTEVIWSVHTPTWDRALAAATGTGADRVVEVFAGWAAGVTGSEFFRSYLRRERDRALRLLTTRHGVHQARVTAAFEGLLRAEQQATGLLLPLPAHDTAYVMTRIAESFIYSDLIAGEEPDAVKAATVIAAILGSHPVPPPQQEEQ